MASNDTLGALPPPPGVEPNFTNPESIANRVIIASVLGPVIAIPLCITRIYTKRFILRNFGYDDYSIVLATFLALGSSITTAYQTNNGLGTHIWDVPAYKFHAFMKLGSFAGPIFYHLATLFTKVSLCLFYLRLSPSKTFRFSVYVLLTVSVLYSMLAALGFAWVCHPIAKYWDFSITTGRCINLGAYFLANACLNAATDLTLLVLPLFIIKRLRLPMRRKIGVAFLLMTGSFVCVISLIRLQIVVKSMQTSAADGTWGMVPNFIWLVIEVWLGIVCACLPALHAFMRGTPSKHEGHGNVNLHVVRGPRNQRIGPHMATDSEAFEDMRETSFTLMDSDTHVRGASALRSVTSDKSLLATAARSEC